MASSSRPKLSEKGLLTPDNCVIAFIDLQPQMLFGVTTVSYTHLTLPTILRV